MEKIDETMATLNELYEQYKAANDLMVHNLVERAMEIQSAPQPVIGGYRATYRYGLATNAWKMSEQPIGAITSIAASKGDFPLKYIGAKSPTLGMCQITKDKLLFVQNQANTKWTADILDKPGYPVELWFAVYITDYFMWEKFIEEPLYAGDMGDDTGIRFTNDNTDNHQFANAPLKTNDFNFFRVVLTANGTSSVNVDFWLNGVKQKSTVPVTGWFRKYFTVGIGAETNNEYVGWAELFTTPLLNDEQAGKIFAELQTEYKPFNLPVAKGLYYIQKADGNVTVFYNKTEDIKSIKVRWVDWNKGGPGGSIYRPELDDKLTVPAFEGRAEITAYDANGNYFSIPSTKYFKPW